MLFFHCHVGFPGCTLAETNSKLFTKNRPNLAKKKTKTQGSFPFSSMFRWLLLLVLGRVTPKAAPFLKVVTFLLLGRPTSFQQVWAWFWRKAPGMIFQCSKLSLLQSKSQKIHSAGQIMATSPQNVADGNPLISGKSRLVKYYYIWPDSGKLSLLL